MSISKKNRQAPMPISEISEKADQIDYLINLELDYQTQLKEKGKKTTTLEQHIGMLRYIKGMVKEVIDADIERLDEIKIRLERRYQNVGRPKETIENANSKKATLNEYLKTKPSKPRSYEDFDNWCIDKGKRENEIYSNSYWKKIIRY